MRFLFVVACGIASIFGGAWALMLLFGVLHAEVSGSVPAIGYGPALAIVGVVALYRMINGLLSGVIEEASK